MRSNWFLSLSFYFYHSQVSTGVHRCPQPGPQYLKSQQLSFEIQLQRFRTRIQRFNFWVGISSRLSIEIETSQELTRFEPWVGIKVPNVHGNRQSENLKIIFRANCRNNYRHSDCRHEIAWLSLKILGNFRQSTRERDRQHPKIWDESHEAKELTIATTCTR